LCTRTETIFFERGQSSMALPDQEVRHKA
jgi:hypothetical protein